MQGWICLHRKVRDCWVAKDKPYNYYAAWIDMLLMASHEEKKFLHGKELLTIQPGEFVTSARKLAEEWGWSRGKVDRFLKMLESDQKIVIKTSQKRTTVCIVNWGVYQDSRANKEPQTSHRRATDEPLTDTINNINNDNNINKKEKYIKEKHKYGEFQNVLLTDEELEKLKEKRPDNWEECIEILSEGLARKGYKYKSHYLAILKWTEKEVRKGESKNDREQREDIRKADEEFKFS